MIWGKINLPDVAKKKIKAPIISNKINFLYKSDLLEFIFFLEFLKINKTAIMRIITINNLNIDLNFSDYN